jgi:hypothetical protein
MKIAVPYYNLDRLARWWANGWYGNNRCTGARRAPTKAIYASGFWNLPGFQNRNPEAAISGSTEEKGTAFVELIHLVSQAHMHPSLRYMRGYGQVWTLV